MSLKWILALLIFTYIFNFKTYAADLHFDALIEESYQDQIQLAAEIQRLRGAVT